MAFYDDPYFIVFFALACIATYSLYSLHLKNKRAVQQTELRTTGQRNTKVDFNGYIDGIITGLPMAKQIYDQTAANMKAKNPNITDEEIAKELKPLADKIKQAQWIAENEPLARIGANLGNKVSKMIEGIL